MRSHIFKRIVTVLAFTAVLALTGCANKNNDTRIENANLPTLEVKSDTGSASSADVFDPNQDQTVGGPDVSVTDEATAVQDPTEPALEATPEITPETTPEATPEVTPEVTEEVTQTPTGEPGNTDAQEGQTAGAGTAEEQTGSEGEDENKTDPNRQFVVVLDPGHGGKWAGACYIGLQEKDLTLKVAKYARDYLLNNYRNISVYLTREDDGILNKDIKLDLEMRCELAKEVGADCLVSIHFNATDAHKESGTEVWASRRSNIHDQTFELGECIMQELVALGLKRRAVTSRKSTDMFDADGRAYDYYAINRHCAARDVPGIIVEQCFMDSEHDQQFITSEEGLQSLGDANARGIAAYFGLLPKE